MLGDGIVSFGVWRSDATECRNSNASPKIVVESSIRSSTCSDGGANSIVPRSLRKRTCSVSSITFEIPSS